MPGDSLSRNEQSTDSNTLLDFDVFGGGPAFGPTPGFINIVLPLGVIVDDPAPEDKLSAKKWNILLYFAADSNIREAFEYNLLEAAKAGGSNENVNILVLFDSATTQDPDPARRAGAKTLRGKLGGLDAAGRYTVLKLPGQEADLGDLDTGDPRTLKDFIAWAKTNYPAERSALIFGTHGEGWKGLSPDNSAGGLRDKLDWIRMGELSMGLAGSSFEWIAFHACLMASVEVASQIQSFAKFMLASEEVMRAGAFPYADLTTQLRERPEIASKDLALFVHEGVKKRNEGRTGDARFDLSFKNIDWTYSVTDLAQIKPLEASIETWSKQLRTGVGLLQKRDDPLDNVQLRIREQALAATRFTDNNYLDLDHFATLVSADGGIPTCAKSEAVNLSRLLRGSTVIAEGHGSRYPNVRGLHINFPVFRTLKGVTTQHLENEEVLDAYDSPDTRVSTGSSRLAAYAPNLSSSLPLKALDEEDLGQDLKAPREWPRVITPGFNFIDVVPSWPLFLERYYSPVADNTIISALTPSGETIRPVEAAGGACENSIFSIDAPVGSTINFSARGSSDADTLGVFTPTHYFWDLDASKACVGIGCIAPTAVPPGSNAATASNDNKDQDLIPANSSINDQDASGMATTFKCETPVFRVITLDVWDDNHTFPLHNTRPDASFVNPQTDFNQSTITCSALPTFTWFPPPQIFETYTIPFVFNVTNPDGSPGANLPATVEGTGGVTVNGQSTGNKGEPIRAAVSQVTTDRFGNAFLAVRQPGGSAGTVSVTIPGLPVQRTNFTVRRPNDPAGADLDFSGPSGLTLNQAATLTGRVISQRGPVSLISYIIKSGNARFNDAQLFYSNRGTQIFTAADGIGEVSLTATAGGVVEVTAYTGTVQKTLRIPVSGGSAPPDTLTLSGLPKGLIQGTSYTLNLAVLTGTQAVSGLSISLQFVQGSTTTPVTLTTDARGAATYRFTPLDVAPVSFTISAGPLRRTLTVPVSPPAR